MTKVSIIITSFNKEPFIKEAIDSALNQNFENFNILIVDDGSTDNSIDIIKKYKTNPRVKIILKENEGIIKTRNKAIGWADGDYILQLDADDILGENFLNVTVPILENNSKIGIVYCLTKFIGFKSKLWDLGDFSIKKQLTTNQIVITALFRKIDYLKTEGYRECFSEGYEDWDFWLSIMGLGLEVKQVKEIEFYYRITNNSRNYSFSKNTLYELKNKIFKYHTKLYYDNDLNSTNLLWQNLKLEEEVLNLTYYKNSIDYKIGHFLLFPFRYIKNIFFKKQ